MSEAKDRVSGRVKQAAGDLSGDDELAREGEVEEGAADAKGKVDEVVDRVKDTVDRARDKVDEVVDSTKDRLRS